MKQWLLVLLLLTTPAMAGDFYFDDCASGGDGTSGDPWCIDPDGGGALGDISFAMMTDGITDCPDFPTDCDNAEVVPGDNIILCASGCGAAGQTGIYRVATSGDSTTTELTRYFLGLRVSGTEANPITVKVFCTGGNCDTVDVNGDTDADDTFDEPLGKDDPSGEPETMIYTNAAAGDDFMLTRLKWWVFDGNPIDECGAGADGYWQDCTSYLEFSHGGDHILKFNDPGQGQNDPPVGPGNIVFNAVTFAHTEGMYLDSDHLWGSEVNEAPCNGLGHHGTRVNAIHADITFQNGKMHHLCGTANRENNNYKFAMNFTNNEMYNVKSFLDANFFNGDFVGDMLDAAEEPPPTTWSGNFLYDSAFGLSIEENTRNYIVEYNIIACLGIWEVRPTPNSNGCGTAINISDDQANYGAQIDQTMGGYRVRYNKIYADPVDPEAFLVSAIELDINNDYDQDADTIVENNVIWHVRADLDGLTSGDCCRGVISVSPDQNDGAGILIQNNSLLSNDNGMTVYEGVPIIRNNLIVNCDVDACVWYDSDATSTGLDRNLIIPEDAGTWAFEEEGGGTDYTCGTIDQIGTGNRCETVVFDTCDDATYCANIDADENNWDLHLDATDTDNIDVLPGTSGTDFPAVDIDGDARPSGAGDAGADEVTAASDPTLRGVSGGFTIAQLLAWSCRTGIGACLEKP